MSGSSTVEANVSPVPPFRILLPGGWREYPATRETMARLTEQSRQVFRSAHRPDLDSQFTRMMEQLSRRMKQAGVFAVYLQTEVTEEDMLAVSMTASVVRGRLGGTLDRQVSAMFSDRGAQFLTEDQSIVRWTADAQQQGEFDGITSRTIDYLIAVPGTGRRTAVQFTTVLPYPSGDPDVIELVDAVELLSDTVVSTFAWEPMPQ